MCTQEAVYVLEWIWSHVARGNLCSIFIFSENEQSERFDKWGKAFCFPHQNFLSLLLEMDSMEQGNFYFSIFGKLVPYKRSEWTHFPRFSFLISWWGGLLVISSSWKMKSTIYSFSIDQGLPKHKKKKWIFNFSKESIFHKVRKFIEEKEKVFLALGEKKWHLSFNGNKLLMQKIKMPVSIFWRDTGFLLHLLDDMDRSLNPHFLEELISMRKLSNRKPPDEEDSFSIQVT